MPSLVTLPFIQCQKVCGRAESGGLLNPLFQFIRVGRRGQQEKRHNRPQTYSHGPNPCWLFNSTENINYFQGAVKT